jgi:CBS domain containing-hemolysin-like protein
MIPVLLFLVITGLLFFALVETAFGLLMRLPQRLEAERESESDALTAYLEDPLKFFVPSRVMRGSLLVAAVVLLARPIGTDFPGWLVLLAIGVGISIGVGQIVPTLIVRRAPERVLELLLPAFTAVANLIVPVTALIIGWIGTADRERRIANGAPAPESGEPSSPKTGGEPERADESRLLRSVVDFGETLVREVMTPRPDIVAIRADATLDDLRQLVRDQEYSRLPVYTDNLDNIVGLVVVKDLIQTEPNGSRLVAEMMRPAAFVPETKRVVDLLREFRQGRTQLAMVVDEYGGTAGLVTVEDVVEELVGEIRDEYDSDAEPVVREGDDVFVFSGKVAIGEMAERLGIEVDDDGFETVGGFVLARAGRVPLVGERFDTDGLTVEILEAERRRIHKVRIRRPQPAPAEAAE